MRRTTPSRASLPDAIVVTVIAPAPLSSTLSTAVAAAGAQMGPLDPADPSRVALIACGGDGAEIRALADGAALRGTILAVVAAPGDAVAALDAGADDFIVWPRDADVLATRIALAAARHRAPPILANVFARLPDLVFRTTHDGRLLDGWTGGGVLRTDPVSFVGKSVEEVLPVEAARLMRSGYSALAGGSGYASVRYYLPEGGVEQPWEARLVQTGAPTDDVFVIIRPAPAHVPLRLDHQTSEEIFRSVFDAAGVGISVALPGGGIGEANPAFCRLLGYSEAELRGRHYLDFCHPDDVDVDLDLRRQVTSGERDSYSVAKRYLTKDGRTVWTQLTVSVVRDATGAIRLGIGMIEDKSEQRRSEFALRASEARLRVVVESAHNLVYEWALDGGVMSYYETATDAGFRAQALPRTRVAWMAAIHPEDRARVASELDGHIEERTPFAIEYRVALADADWRWVIDRGCALTDGTGGARRVVGAVTDVTERRRLEGRLSQSEKMEAVGRLAGGIAHDFNNLLVAIINNIDFAIEAIEPGQVRRDLEDARVAAERAAGLTRQILTFSRRQALQTEALSLNQLIARMMRMLRRVVGSHVRFVFKPGAELWPVRADPAQMEQILVNLCVNARDAMADGGKLTLATANVTLEADNHVRLPAGRYVRLEVADTGGGIPPDVLPRIFDPFFTTKPSGHGSGLGLPMVYGIVQQHGGEVEAETAPDVGTTLRIFLPRLVDEPVAAEPAPETAHSAEPEEADAPVDATILVAEDDDHVRRTTVRLLESQGYRVLSAADGIEAVTMFEAHRTTIDLVLLDVVMPRASGRQAFDRIREVAPTIPIVFMSGYSTEVLDPDFARQQPLLMKPFARERLLRFVSDALADTEGTAGPA